MAESHFRYKFFIRLKDTKIKDIINTGDKKEILHCFTIVSPLRTLTLMAPTKKIKDLWIKKITTQINERKEALEVRASLVDFPFFLLF